MPRETDIKPSAINPELEILRLSLRGATVAHGDSDRLRVVRLPEWTRAQYDDVNVWWASACASGARLEFTTTAMTLRLRLHLTRPKWEGRELRDHVFALEVDGDLTHVQSLASGGDVAYIDAFGSLTTARGSETNITFDVGSTREVRRVTIWLPHNSHVHLLGISGDGTVSPAPAEQPRWVHYGSSISQSGEADTPSGVWPVRAARELGLDLLNLGLAGAAHLDGFAARSVRDAPADLITTKLGINVVNGATLRVRTFVPTVHSFLDTIREGQPTTPIVVISPIFCPAHEAAPGPTDFDLNGFARASSLPRLPHDGQLTLRDIRSRLKSAVADRSATDANLYYVNGLDLLGPSDEDHLPDGLHPDDSGLQLIAERFARHTTTRALIETVRSRRPGPTGSTFIKEE